LEDEEMDVRREVGAVLAGPREGLNAG